MKTDVKIPQDLALKLCDTVQEFFGRGDDFPLEDMLVTASALRTMLAALEEQIVGVATGASFPRVGKRYHPADFTEEERRTASKIATRIYPLAQEVLGVHALDERQADVVALALSGVLYAIDR